MFSLPDVDFGFAGSQTKVFVKKNGTAGPLKEVKLPPNSKLCDLFEKASKVLDLDNPHKAFYSNGVECTDIEHVEEDEVIHISCGEAFKLHESGESRAGSQVVGNYILHEKLGQGGFGSVMKGVHSETGDPAAIKFVPKKSFRQFSDLQRVFQEIQALRNLRHPNIIRILDVADNPDSICFIMEYAAGGELRGYVEKHASLSEEESRTFFKQMVRAVHYIHSKKIIHRDLKLENILLDGQNRCKIVDFGLSDYVSGKDRTVTDAGTEAYLAPEVYNGLSGDHDPFKIDSWALGVILYAMTHGKLPFSRPDHDTCVMLDKDGLSLSDDITRSCAKLTKAMLTPSPDKRASVDQISIDPWVTMHRFASFSSDGGDLPVHLLVDPSFSSEENITANDSSGTDQQGTSRQRRTSRSNTTPGALVDLMPANSPPVSPAVRPVPSPNVTPDHRLEEPRSPRGRDRLGIYDAGVERTGSPRVHAAVRRQHSERAKDRVLPSLPAGRGAAGGAGSQSYGRRRDHSPMPRRGLHK
jgi:MAP/microtubule affinity-regulating kinase